MPRVCTICTHADRDAIDRALVAGDAIPAIAALHRVSEDALLRHKGAHLRPLVLKAREAAQRAGEARALDVLAQLRAINAASQAVLKEARDGGDGELALKAVDRIQRQLELQAKLLGDLSDAPINILVAPQWLTLRATIFAALAPYPEARAALAEALTDAG